MARGVRSPTEFASTYKIDSTGTYAERAARFLNDGANEMPYRFFDKRLVAKIAFGLSKTPGENSDMMKRLSSVLSTANRILMREANREVWIDPLEGVRATVDESDLLRTKHRRKRRRVRNAAVSLEQTDALIDQSKVEPELRKELTRSRKSLKLLTEALKELPQLLPHTGPDEDQS